MGKEGVREQFWKEVEEAEAKGENIRHSEQQQAEYEKFWKEVEEEEKKQEKAS